MKKFLPLTLSLCLALGISSPGLADNDERDNGETEQVVVKNQLKLSKNEIERLIQLGYTEKQIELMTPEEYEREKNDHGKLVATEGSYYRIQKGKKPEKISKQQALKEVKEYKEKLEKKGQHTDEANTMAYDDDSETSWMYMETKVTKYTDDSGAPTGEYRFKHDFEWLTEPFWELTDVVAITHHDFFTYEEDSEYFKYYYDRYYAGEYYDTKSVTDRTADEMSPEGLAFEVDLLSSDNSFDVRNHEGYMYYRTYLNDWDRNSGNVFGHYTHAEVGVTNLTINLITGQLSVSGMVKKSDMPDTGVELDLP